MRIEISDLRAVSEKLILHLEEQGIGSLEIPVDYYWNISKEQIYDPYREPSHLDMGQLTDDWNELQKLIKSNNEPLVYYFVWLAAILRAVGEHISV
jgi:hypothetical protein